MKLLVPQGINFSRSLGISTDVSLCRKPTMFTMMFESVFCNWLSIATILAYVIYWYSTNTFNYWKDRGIPYLKPTPGLGNTTRMHFRLSFAEQFKIFYDSFDGKPFCGVFQFRSPILVVRDPNIIKLVLVKDFACFQVIFFYLLLCE
jgi:cytochrome P450 family 6